MEKNLKEKVAKLSAKVLESVAYSTSDSACLVFTYQPREPETLRRK